MLSPKKINHNSPTKQNISPSKRANEKKDEKIFQPQILMSAIHELQCIIVKLGGKVPSHLNYGFNVKADIIRPQPVDNNDLHVQIKNLKVKLSNYEFELKKLQEDQAQYKLMSKMDRDKDTKKLKAEIAKLQLHSRQDNHKWELKFEQMREIYQKKTRNEISKIKQQCQQTIKNIKESSSKQISELIDKYTRIIQQIEKVKTMQMEQIKAQAQIKIQIKQKQHQQQKQKTRIKHVESVQKLEKKQQQMIIAFDSQKKIEQKKKDDEKISFNKTKEKLYNDLYNVRKQKQQLNKIILGLKTQILQLKKMLEVKDQQMKKIKSTHKSELEKIECSKVYQIQKIKYNNKLQIQDIYKQHDKRLAQYQKIVRNLEETKQNREQLFKKSQQEIEKKFEERPSKTEDTTKIQRLNYQIMAKEQQLNTARTQLKRTKLERDNNEKNYTRIFSAHGPRQKLSDRKNAESSRQKDRDKVYRQANTIDMSFLLKVCNKNF